MMTVAEIMIFWVLFVNPMKKLDNNNVNNELDDQ